ncbi:MAG TPA: acyl-ACP--UDP-N-acetylglucosamine O-acyltransferase [Planctomycetota bacterium]|nr:acyl-ACP--UDP-N-acetylglucosamine O-acyltransferase [Planctomycetota bacterium]
MAIHPTAIVYPGAQVDPTAEVGPYAVIGPNVTLGAGCKIFPHAVVEGYVKFGKENQVYPFTCIGGAPQDLKFSGEISWIEIGDGNAFREYVTVNPGTKGGGNYTRIGNANLIMAYVHIAHDCIIGNNTVIANSTQLGGHVIVENSARISGMVAVHHFVTIGKMAFVAACAKVAIDVPPFMITDGFRVRKLNDELLRRSSVSDDSHQALRKCFRLLYRSELNRSEALERIRAEKLEQFEEVAYLLDFYNRGEGHERMAEAAYNRPAPALRDGQHHQDVKDILKDKKP